MSEDKGDFWEMIGCGFIILCLFIGYGIIIYVSNL